MSKKIELIEMTFGPLFWDTKLFVFRELISIPDNDFQTVTGAAHHERLRNFTSGGLCGLKLSVAADEKIHKYKQEHAHCQVSNVFETKEAICGMFASD